jgi:hypothetical protein
MSDIPLFKSTSHQDAYYDIFEENLIVYYHLMSKVRQKLYSGYSFDHLSGESMTNVRKITEFLIKSTNKEFSSAYTQYKEKEFLTEQNEFELSSLRQLSLGD